MHKDINSLDTVINKISEVVCVCCLKDARVWKKTSANVVKYIDADRYTVIVPDEEVHKFRTCLHN